MSNNQGQQKLPVDPKDVELIRGAFKDNDELLLAMRALLQGFAVSDEEKALVRKTFSEKPELLEAVRRKMYQKLDKNAPIGVNPDFWVGVEQAISGQHPDTIKQIIGARERTLDMLERGIELLKNPDGEQISMEYVPSEDDSMGTHLIARNLYIQATENGLSFLKIIAGMDPEELEEKRKKDSAR